MKRLPFFYKNTLSPWFKEADLDRGWELLSAESLTTLFFRNFGGGLFTGKTVRGEAIIGFSKVSGKIRNFKIDQFSCTCCTKKQSINHLCCHLAAVVLSLMVECEEAEKLQPLPIYFEHSFWADIASYLYDELDSLSGNRMWSLEIDGDAGEITAEKNDNPLVSVKIDAQIADFLHARFSSRLQVVGSGKSSFLFPEELKHLGDELCRLSLRDGERELLSRGYQTHALSRDDSLCFWLIRMIYFRNKHDFFVMRADDDQGSSFSIKIDSDTSHSFTLIPSRNRGVQLFKLFNKKQSGNYPFLPPAHSFWHTSFNEDSSAICCVAMLRLETGEVFSRKDLAPQQWGNFYYLPELGFLPVLPVPSDADLCPPGSPIQGSLFGDDADRKKLECGFEVSGTGFVAFIEENKDALKHSHNETESSLLHFVPVEKPQRVHFDLLKSDEDWCYLAASYGLGTRDIDLTEILEARRKGWEYLPGREWFKLQDTPFSWLHNLGDERIYRDENGKKYLKLKRWEILTIASQLDCTMGGYGRGGNGGQEDQGLVLPIFDRWKDLSGTEVLNHLREYQKKGLDWLVQLLSNGIGGILADEMGLGKTHQALALLDMIAGSDASASFLVVAPASVIYPWAEKIDRFYPALNWGLYHGSDRDLEECLDKQIILTTYGIVNRDEFKLAECFFEVIIFDEIQHLKNKKTRIHSASAKLKAGIKLGLTGTPMENSPNDLKALLDICLPGVLGSDRMFQHRFTIPIVEEQSEDRRRELSERIAPFFLRRLRSQVLTELPEIIEDKRSCKLHDDQIRLYREFLSGQGQKLVAQLNDEKSDIPYMEVLALITYLKQICNHPCLISGGSNPEEYGSGKWSLFKELLNECLDSGYKVVVFSQYTSMLDLIETYLSGCGIGIARLRGGMNLKKRQREINHFQNEKDCQVFCASLLAGGTGIDLTAAQCVIHYDRWWNAAREDQATSRVHRIGQTQVVEVFKLITAGTLEEKIDKLICRRRVLAGQLVQADDGKLVKGLNRKDLLDLLSFHDTSV